MAEAPFAWVEGWSYRIRAETRERTIIMAINGEVLIECRDDEERAYTHGAVGVTMLAAGHALYRDFVVTGNVKSLV